MTSYEKFIANTGWTKEEIEDYNEMMNEDPDYLDFVVLADLKEIGIELTELTEEDREFWYSQSDELEYDDIFKIFVEYLKRKGENVNGEYKRNINKESGTR